MNDRKKQVYTLQLKSDALSIIVDDVDKLICWPLNFNTVDSYVQVISMAGHQQVALICQNYCTFNIQNKMNESIDQLLVKLI
jgi:hypothetical protein